MTHNWSGVVDLIPVMRQHLHMTGSIKEYRPGSSISRSSSGDDEGDEEYSVIFRELFCVAAAELANQLDEPLETLGTLHDGIMQTGKTKEKKRKSDKASCHKSAEDIEKGPRTIKTIKTNGKGQLLLLARSIDKFEANRLVSCGFRFATLGQVGNIMARSMLVSLDDLMTTMEQVRTATKEDSSMPQGLTYISCFAIRADLRAVRNSTPKWEILVPKDAPGQLPSVQLCAGKLGQPEISVISQLDGMTVQQCVQQLLRSHDGTFAGSPSFALKLREAILELIKKVSEPFFLQAIFCAKPFQLQHSGDGNEDAATILPFCIIPDVHTIALTSPKLVYTSLSFFKVRQQVTNDAPDHAALARKIHQEFSALAARKDVAAATAAAANGTYANRRSTLLSRGGRWPFTKSTSSQSSRSVVTLGAENPLELENVNVQPQKSEPAMLTQSDAALAGRPRATTANHPWGGIMVHSDVTVNANSKEDSHMETRELGNKAEASVAAQEQPTFVDELFRMACTRFQKDR